MNVPEETTKKRFFNNTLSIGGRPVKISILIILLSVVCVCLCCAISVALSSTPSAKATQTAISLAETAKPTNTMVPLLQTGTAIASIPTNTPEPTRTTGPTETPEPTETATSTLTPTMAPSPIVIEGKGDDVVDVNKSFGPGIIEMVNSGSSNFVVENYGSDGERYELLANEIGRYVGRKPIDFMQDEETTNISVKSNGTWKLSIYPLAHEAIRSFTAPGKYVGKGDDVIKIIGSSKNAKIGYVGKGNFAVISYSEKGRDLLVNEIGSYQGTIMFQFIGWTLLDVTGEGSYTIELK